MIKAIKVILKNGERYIGNNEQDIIMQLKLEDWTTYPNVTKYKENIKRRIAVFDGQRIEHGTDREFLNELKRVGFIKEIIEVV